MNGEEFYYLTAASIIAQTKELQDLMRLEKDTALVGHLIVGTSSTIGNYLLPEIIGHFVTDYPKAKITLRVANTEQIIQQLFHFDIDIGIIEGRCCNEKIKILPWKKDELIVISSPQHPLRKKRKITLHDLCSAKWVLREVGF